MAWQERLSEAAYTSPSGVRITFAFENVSRETEKQTSAFNFPDAAGTYVQDMGRSGRRYPMRIFLWGDNHDLQANIFEAALLEQGIATLEHPLYGIKDVVLFGKVKQRDDLKTAANQTILEFVLWETIGIAYTAALADPVSDIKAALEAYKAAVAEELANATDLSGEVNRISFVEHYKALLKNVKEAVSAIAEFQENVQSQFNAINDSIHAGIDTLISDPLTLAFQTTLLIQAPARALESIQARLSAYDDLANSIISGNGAVVAPDHRNRNSNQFYANDLVASTATTGSVLSAVNNTFTSKPEAIEAAESVITLFDSVTAWREANFRSLGVVDAGIAHQELQKAVFLTAGFLVQISFSLKQERRAVLTRNRAPIELCAELYGRTDSVLDFFIDSNDLSGDEHLEIKAGREVVYYV